MKWNICVTLIYSRNIWGEISQSQSDYWAWKNADHFWLQAARNFRLRLTFAKEQQYLWERTFEKNNRKGGEDSWEVGSDGKPREARENEREAIWQVEEAKICLWKGRSRPRPCDKNKTWRFARDF